MKIDFLVQALSNQLKQLIELQRAVSQNKLNTSFIFILQINVHIFNINVYVDNV